LGIKTNKIETNRLLSVKKIAATFGGVTVLKGAKTLVAQERKKVVGICTAGNPGMATAGMGDLLTGIIAGLLAQNLTFFAAAKLGVLLHAMAGDRVAVKYGSIGMLASDILPEVRALLFSR
jgi:NAD(P)H-hydrate repair Nnr-like enzyme with NAD(P)H-hydrate dehydratase domain